MKNISVLICTLFTIGLFLPACGSGINDQARAQAAKFVTEAETAYTNADFKTATEKFKMASAKFDEALNGGTRGDSPLHTKFACLRDASKKWSEMAEVENQAALGGIKDTAKIAELRKEVDAQISCAKAAL